ncbi:MAG: tol-pal system protein YbgF [Rhodanobacteraceae bacterium]
MAASAAMIVAAGLPCAASAQAAPQTTTAPVPNRGVTRVNRIQALEAQMQQMQGQIEVLQHKLQQLEQSSKDQYTDLDSRISRLEHTGPAAAASAAPRPSAAAISAPVGAASAAVHAAPQASAPMSATDKAAAQKAYDTAFKSLRDGNYVDSARDFRAFIDKYPQSTLVSNAYYWLGESYYVTQNFKVALNTFQTLLQKYPDSRKAPDAKLKVGYCQFEMKDYASARRTLEAVAKAYPGTTVERLAKNRLQDFPPQASGH